MLDPYKLSVKIGGSEFEAEGPEEAVKSQFSQFLEAVKHMGASMPSASRTVLADGRSEAAPPLKRFFAEDDNGLVSLLILPKTDKKEADSLLLLLYGYQEVAEKSTVIAGELMRATRRSGIQLGRLDKTIAVHKSLITEGGTKRGKRYGLNNQGRLVATEILRGML